MRRGLPIIIIVSIHYSIKDFALECVYLLAAHTEQFVLSLRVLLLLTEGVGAVESGAEHIVTAHG